MKAYVREPSLFQNEAEVVTDIVRRKQRPVRPFENIVVLNVAVPEQPARFFFAGLDFKKDAAGFRRQRKRSVAGTVFRLVLFHGFCDL